MKYLMSVLLIAITLFFLWVTLAHSQEWDVEYDNNPTTPLIATVTIYNYEGTSSPKHGVAIEEGMIWIKYITTGNGNCLWYDGKPDYQPDADCSDIVIVTDWPMGIIVEPIEQRIPENDHGYIRIYRYEGF